MSYCRWSSDNFKSDVYVYEHVDGGWVTHVAVNRIVGTPPDDPLDRIMAGVELSPDAALDMSKARDAFLETCDRVPIGLPHDGETFRDGSPGECAATLRRLRDLGYYVPEYAITELEAEEAILKEGGGE